ncbi:MAG: RluA family pseudouridine synthase [Spirochaetes bacterium]|nr:RluA family pseudouridine synthase [Spirochaetota bacterium]
MEAELNSNTEPNTEIRIDKYISDYLKVLTRSQLKARDAKVYLNGKETKLSKTVRIGDTIEIEYDTSPEIDIKPEKIDLAIIYEDENIAVINKPQGMVVHPAAGNPTGTLVNAFLYHFADTDFDPDDDDRRPGIVHRLDKDTSGVIITAKNSAAHEFLSNQFRKKRVVKKYLAVVKGKMQQRAGIIETNLARDRANRKKFAIVKGKGKEAVTSFRVLKEFQDASLVSLEPETGRTHQLRVHMLHCGCPIIGDPLYSRKIAKYGDITMMLHAHVLIIEIPGCGIKKFNAPVPDRFKKFIKDNR